MTDDSPSDTFSVFGVTLSVCKVCENPAWGDVEVCRECEGLIEELEQLADEWLRKSNPTGERDYDHISQTEREMYHRLAQELRELLEDYR